MSVLVITTRRIPQKTQSFAVLPSSPLPSLPILTSRLVSVAGVHIKRDFNRNM